MNKKNASEGGVVDSLDLEIEAFVGFLRTIKSRRIRTSLLLIVKEIALKEEEGRIALAARRSVL